jgi:signal transduction histidine kinase/ligand-binding sensor domain-containing protein/DNA-binding response OmpR family regulator
MGYQIKILFALVIHLLLPLNTIICQQDRFYTPYHGLSNTSFNALYQDNDGFLWIATQKGLNKFDGHNFFEYQHNPNDSNSLDNSSVITVYQDSKETIWVCTEYGIHIYNKKSDNFTRIPFYINNYKVFVQISSILEDKQGFLWLFSSHGLIKFNTKNFSTYYYHSSYIKNPNSDRFLLNAAIYDNNGNIWIGSDKNGLICFNPLTEQFVSYKHEPGKNSLCDNSILSLGKDLKGNIIIGTIKGGISIFNPVTKVFTTISPSLNPANRFNGGVYSIITDKKGTVWIGTERNGLKSLNTNTLKLSDSNSTIDVNNIEDSKIHCYLDKENNLWLAIDYTGIYLKKDMPKPFLYINKNSANAVSLSNNIVKSILKDKSGNLWVGTDGGGLNYLSNNKSQITYYQNNPQKTGSIPDNAIISLFEDDNENIWIGTYLGGLSVFNKKTGTFCTYLIDPQRKGRDYNFVTSIISDHAGNLWISTNGGGLHHFNTTTKKFTRISSVLIDNSIVQLPVFLTTLLLDNDGTLWIGSYNGLYCWNPKKGTYASFTSANGSIENEGINSLLEKDNNIWFGTSSGLYAIEKSSYKIVNFSTNEGLCSNSVFGILEDNNGYLWLSTLNGLSKFDTNTKVFRNYYTYDGLPANEFRPASCFKASDGMLYFGSTFGVVFFNPDSIHEISTFPTLVLTNFKIYNSILPIGSEYDKRVILTQSINETKEITLNFSDKNFTIDFAAIEYNAPEKIKYAYILEDFDKKWNYRDYSQRYATYTNLSPGKYTFRIKSTNSDGLWNEKEKTIHFRIRPPFWRTWWAYTLYLLIISAILVTSRKLALFRIAMQNKLKLEQIEREKLEELNQSKMQFFSNVSHEFRTPLTLILGPVEKMLYSKTEVPAKKQLEFIHRNTLRLLRLVNLLLDLQKVEKNEMHLNAQVGDIVGFSKEIAHTFNDLALQKKITLSFTSGTNKLDAWFDPDKLDKVLFNLLSNAIKYTPKGGEINVNLLVTKIETNPEPNNEFIQISVSDTGKGIKEEYLNKIFNRFYQVENREPDEIQIGTGIGLHLTKYLVELHKGWINVTSKPGEGTRFDIFIPLGTEFINQNHNNYQGIEFTESEKEKQESLDIQDITKNAGIPGNTQGKKGPKAHRILIVEDDYDVRTYIKSELGEYYDIYEATDGVEGWSVIKDKMPDLVISDVLMPNMDGIQLCKKIKTEINTSHIPVILLTARTSIENRIEGLETGADSYIPKPFHPQHLKIRVEKLIELRQSLINKFSKTISFEASEVTLTSADEKFLQKAINLVKENIANPDLNIEDMSTELGMSRVHMYRKLKALTNQTPNEFVRTIRLKQAAAFLAQNKLNISEVAYAVGFRSHQYFSNCFQNYFKMSPKEYSMMEKKE